VEIMLYVWAQSRWRGPVNFTHAFITASFAHLPQGSPVMFHLDKVHDRTALKLLTVTFTNPFDAYVLLGQVLWWGYESIFFTMHNIFTNCECIFPTTNQMHYLFYDFE
jgi:hypothetical protein